MTSAKTKKKPAKAAPKPKAGQSQSVYAPGPKTGRAKKHTISLLVDNEPGVVARIAGLFSGRGYNIDSFTGAETDLNRHLSRITVVCSGTALVIEQIKAQLERLVPVREVRDLTTEGVHIERELVLAKVEAEGKNKSDALRIANKYKAKKLVSSSKSMIFEITDTSEKIEKFITALIPLGLTEVSRSGVAALSPGLKRTKKS